MAERIFKGDTAQIEASLFEEDGVNALPATTYTWEVRKPNGATITGTVGTPDTDVVVSITDTALPGQYIGRVQFTLTDGSLRSVPFSFEVVDPLESTDNTSTGIEEVIDQAWMRLEDMFDSELGGPWLRDKTTAILDRTKLGRLLPGALYYVNNFYQPVTTFDETSFPFTTHTPLLAQALLVEGIYHLIRSYVEQPNPIGSNISYLDRRDYKDRWQSVLTAEEKKLDDWIDLFKRDFLGFGSTAILIGGYSGSGRIPRYMRGRYPYTIRY